MIRTPRLPLLQSRAATVLTVMPVMTASVVAFGVWLPMGPLAAYFKLQALPAAFFPWLAGILAAYCVLTTLMKRVYIWRYGWQ